MFTRLFFFSFFLIASLQAKFSIIEDSSNLTLKHPSFQEREVEKVELANGVSALLISDPKTDQSAISVAVGVGSWNDPIEYPGTAHFLEHMLFYKSEAYPQTHEIFKEVSNHDGMLNAFTMPDRTVYTLAVNNDAFIESMRRLAHFFIDPIITDQDMQKEIKAVDQEFQKNWEHDGWRRFFIQKETGNPAHPNASFSTGNLESLSQLTAEQLNDWFDKYYRAQRIFVVVYSSLPIETLREEVDALFSQVPSSEYSLSFIEKPLSSPNQEGKLTIIEPVKDWKRLTLSWELPASFAKDETKSAELIAFALEKTHASNLYTLLQEEALAEGLHVDVETIGEEYAIFDLEIILTTKGVQRKNRVIELCHAALNRLREKNIPDFVYQEFCSQKQLTYEYQDREEAFTYAQSLATMLPLENLSSFPRKSILPTHFDAKKIAHCLQYIIPSRCQYYLMAPSSLTNVAYDREEKWYKTKYTIQSINPSLISSWERAKDERIQLPTPNPYLPERLELVEASERQEIPALIAENNYGKAYYFHEKEFEAPFIFHTLRIKSPLIAPDPKSQALMMLYIKQLDQTTDLITGRAEEAGIKSSISHEDLTLSLEINGFSEKAPLFLEEMGKKLRVSSPTKEEFQQMKEFFTTYFQSQGKDLPLYQGIRLSRSIFKRDNFTHDMLLSALQNLSYEEYLFFVDNLFTSCYVEALFCGNLTKKEAQSLWLDIQHTLRSKPFPTKEHFVLPPPSLKDTPSYLTKELDQRGNLSLLFIDVGFFSQEKKACNSLVAQVLKESFFNELRTKQQTGYIAKAGSMEIHKELFHFFTVQSTSHQPMDLLYRFEQFLEEFVNHIEEKIPFERFEKIKNNLITSLENHNKSLEDRATYFNMAAFKLDGQFDFLQQRIEAFSKLTYEEFILYCRENLSKDNGKRFAILLQGKEEKEPFVYRPITEEELTSMY